MFEVLDPTPGTAPRAGRLAPRLDTLEGKTVGFISNVKEGAKGFFKQRTAAWQTYWARLRTNERRGIQIVGMGRTLHTRPVDVRVDPDGGGQVALRVCGISEGVKVLQDGEPVSQPSPKPTIVRVQMVKLPDESDWRVLSERVGAKC